jgi:glutathione S-transferase
MTDLVYLHGYRYSVYARAARLALLSKKVVHTTVEVDPFVELSQAYLKLHPFGRVPALTHGAFELFETSAITRYVDRAFEGPPLQPKDARAQARMDQVIGVIDAYAYWPMVRQVASHAFFRPFFGEPSLGEEVRVGMEASAKVLGFLNRVAAEGAIFSGREITLADCHFAPMVDYFVRAEEGRDALLTHPALHRWWDQLSGWDALRATDPFAHQSPEN